MIDLNEIRAWHTLILLAVFIGIIVWAYSKKNRASFNEAANLPFADHDMHIKTIDEEKQS